MLRLLNARGPYRRIPEEARNRVLREVNEGGDWKAVAAAYDIKYKTAHHWIRMEGAPTEREGWQSPKKVDRRERQHHPRVARGESTVDTKTMSERLRNELDIRVTQQTIAKHLDGRLITCKKVHVMPQGVNEDDNKRKRRVYVENLLRHVGEQKFVIFINETNFNLFCRRSNGRAARGRRAVVNLPNSKGPNLHIIGAVSATGLVCWERRRGAFKKEDCRDWLRRCLRECAVHGHLMDNVVIVLDNAPAHSQLEVLSNEEEFAGISFCRLAPYSPMLNPIEHVWSLVKGSIKEQMSQGYQTLIAGDPNGVLTQTEFRVRFLEQCADTAMRNVTGELCMRSYNHVQHYFPVAMNLGDMPVGA